MVCIIIPFESVFHLYIRTINCMHCQGRMLIYRYMYVYVCMIGRRRKKKHWRSIFHRFFISPSFLIRVYIEPWDESDREGWSDGKNHYERICTRVIKDNLPLRALSLADFCTCALYHRSSCVSCTQVSKYVLHSISYNCTH
jgi:hypothetical protein